MIWTLKEGLYAVTHSVKERRQGLQLIMISVGTFSQKQYFIELGTIGIRMRYLSETLGDLFGHEFSEEIGINFLLIECSKSSRRTRKSSNYNFIKSGYLRLKVLMGWNCPSGLSIGYTIQGKYTIEGGMFVG